jgi:gluconolactonase
MRVAEKRSSKRRRTARRSSDRTCGSPLTASSSVLTNWPVTPKWSNIEPKDLAARRSGGHVAFMWYRTPFTIPAKIGDFDPSGAVVVLTVIVDDYAEVWVNGAIPDRSGYPSPATIQGHKMPNRVVLGTGVKSGDKLQIAVFGINGPISMAPANTVWFRQATMGFYK